MDGRAFIALYEAEYAYVERTLRRLGVAPGDLADLAHDLFVVVFRRWDERRADRPVRAWLFGIALRLAANYRHRAGRKNERLTLPAEPSVADGTPPADQRLAEARARALVLRALDALDLDHRAVIVLHDLEEATAPEVAATLGIPLNTVYSRLRAARTKVIDEVRRAQGETR